MGVLTKGETQLVFTDTPGFHKPHNKLGEKMNEAVGDTVGTPVGPIVGSDVGVCVGTKVGVSLAGRNHCLRNNRSGVHTLGHIKRDLL